MEKIGAKEATGAMHSLYRELYQETGKLPGSGDVILKGMGDVSGYNLVPYFSTFYIQPGDTVEDEIYENDYKILYYLKGTEPSN